MKTLNNIFDAIDSIFRLVVIALFGAMVLGFASCGDPDEDDTEDTPSTEQADKQNGPLIIKDTLVYTNDSIKFIGMNPLGDSDGWELTYVNFSAPISILEKVNLNTNGEIIISLPENAITASAYYFFQEETRTCTLGKATLTIKDATITLILDSTNGSSDMNLVYIINKSKVTKLYK